MPAAPADQPQGPAPDLPPDPFADQDAPAWSGLEFDEHGLLAGEVGQRMWQQLCLDMEEKVEADGWDQPARLLAVSNPVDTEAEFGAAAMEALRSRVAAQSGRDRSDAHLLEGIPFVVHELASTRAHPMEELWGQRAPGWVAALLLVTEGWAVEPRRGPDGALLPDPHADQPLSEHPDRLEVRTVMMATRSGLVYGAQRTRGQEPEPWPAADIGGALVDAVKRVLGAPTDPPRTSVADALGRMALTTAARMAGALSAGSLVGEPDAHLLAGLDQMRAELADLPGPEREQALAAMVARATAAAVAYLAWTLTEHGTLRLPGALGVRSLAPDVVARLEAARNPSALDRSHMEAVVEAAALAARVSFTGWAAGRHAATVLPAELADLPAGWADEGMLSRWLCGRTLASQPELLERIAGLAGPLARDAAAGAVGLAGWDSAVEDEA